MQWGGAAASQGGVVDRAQLRELGLSERRIDGMVARGELVAVLPGVYRSAATPLTPDAKRWAGVLWSGGVLSHQSAAAVWALPVDEGARVHVSVPDRSFRRRPVPWVCVHRVKLGLIECCRVGDLPITNRVRTTVDLLGVLPLREGRELLGWAMRRRHVRLSDLDRRLVDGRGRTGNVRIRQLREEADPLSHAEFERRVKALLRSAGITGWVAQHPVVLPSGQVIHADLAFPEHRLVVELDGWAHHNTGERFRRDRKRWRGAVAVGWRVVQFTWDDLDHPGRFLREIAQLLAASR